MEKEIGLSDVRIMIVFTVFGITLGFLNIRAWIQHKKIISRISNLDNLYEQLEKTDTKQFEEWKLIITDEYILSASDSLQIVHFSNIEKVELGIQESGLKPNKSIFITLKGNPEKYRIAQAYTANNINAGFFKAFDMIQEKVTQYK